MADFANTPKPLDKGLNALFVIVIVPVAQVSKKSRFGSLPIGGRIVTLGMQGKKDYCQEKLFAHFQLSERIPKNNFYRRLKGVLDLDHLYPTTRVHYGESGQKSIDPVVFFKLCLVGYQENIISDRKIIDHCSLCLDILYFIGYDIDEELPWHSTISRTRQK